MADGMPSHHSVMETLGAELLACRLERGLSRGQVIARLPRVRSVAAYTSYEDGTRTCSVPSLFEICGALSAQPDELPYLVCQRLASNPPVSNAPLRLDLGHVVRDEHPVLAPLRRWASSSWMRPPRSGRSCCRPKQWSNLPVSVVPTPWSWLSCWGGQDASVHSVRTATHPNRPTPTATDGTPSRREPLEDEESDMESHEMLTLSIPCADANQLYEFLTLPESYWVDLDRIGRMPVLPWESLTTRLYVALRDKKIRNGL
jgi:transcriptional regulator with XRE-family HTH domain